MMLLSQFLVVVISASLVVCKISKSDVKEVSAPDGSSFRKDYKFYPSINGWMKLHVIPEQWADARLACAFEGARLASPTSHEMSVEMMKPLQKLDDHEDQSIHIGVHSVATVNDYFSIEGIPLEDMPITWEHGEPDNYHNNERCLAMNSEGHLKDHDCDEVLPFLCYREKVGVMTKNECGNFDKYYSRDNRTGSCYRFHEARMPWHQAHTICSAGGGHLAIINSDLEAQVLAELSYEHKNTEWTYIGFQNWNRGNGVPLWYTLDGKTLEESGFYRWAKGEPNRRGGREDCGSFMQKEKENLGLNDSDCFEPLPFICEIDAKKILA